MALDGATPPHEDTENGSRVITVYTTTRCGDCHATKAYLAARALAYVEVDIEDDPAAAAVVMAVNGGRRSVPTLVYRDTATSLSSFSPAKAAAFLTRCGLLDPFAPTDGA